MESLWEKIEKAEIISTLSNDDIFPHCYTFPHITGNKIAKF